MDKYIIKPLSEISFDDFYESHLLAFKAYPFQWSKEALKKTMHRRGYDASLSFGAFYNGKLVSFTLNGVGIYKSLKTAYDTGTGTVEEHRGKGLASEIFNHSIPFLRAAGIQQYILEVLEENERAFSVYKKQGFGISRKFDCFRVNVNKWKFPAPGTAKDIVLKEIDFSFESQMLPMSDFILSWQNNFQALLKDPGDFKIIGAFSNNRLVGYGIVEPTSGDISQLAVLKQERRKGIGRLILAELKKLNKADIIKVVNVESNQDTAISFLQKAGIPKIVSQFEMIRSV